MAHNSSSDLPQSPAPRATYRHGGLLLLIAGCALLWPATARADGINMGFLAVAGIIVIAPLLAFEVAVEGLVLARVLGRPFRDTWQVALGMNLWSMLAGIPVAIADDALHGTIMPHDLAPYFRVYPWITVMWTGVYFVVTVASEYAALAAWCRKTDLSLPRRRRWQAVLLANVATYAVLAPLHYVVTRPQHDVKAFTDDTRWAAQPTTTVYYLDSRTHHLWSVATDGSARREVVAQAMVEYELVGGPEQVLFATSEGRSFRADGGKVTATAWPWNDRAPNGASGDSPPETAPPVSTYGYFNHHDWYATRTRRMEDKLDTTTAEIGRGLVNCLRIKYADASIRVAADPGYLHLVGRRFTEIAILPNGHELLFDDGQGLYLMDLDTRTVGKLADGTAFCLLTERYRRK